MIVTSLKGGLGNQMFQYASGRALALRMKTDLFFDLSWYEDRPKTDTARQFFLSNFCVEGKKAQPTFKSNITRFYDPPFNGLPYYLSTYLSTLIGLEWLREPPDHSFTDKVFNTKRRNVYFDGYWQSEEYFRDATDIIRKDFTFKHSPHESVKPWIKKINSTQAVSLHIRRGDYANNPATQAYHGLLPLEYYHKAIEYIGARVSAPTIFVFSDDLAWAEKELQSRYPLHFVSHKGADYEDMRLMSLCSHNIIANSSFSWWGAWLNANPHKIIIAPKKWFATGNVDVTNLLPKSWMKVC